MSRPILLVVDDEESELRDLEAALERRYGADYQVVAERSPQRALALLEDWAAGDAPVALVMADVRLRPMTCPDFLVRVRALRPHAKRALLTAFADFGADAELSDLITLGIAEHVVVQPWLPAEQFLYAPVAELLADWTAGARVERYEAVRVVGPQRALRSAEFRDLLDRNGIPYGFYGVDTPEGRSLLAEAGQDGARLPVVVFTHGPVLVDPSNAEVATALGVRTRPAAGTYDLVILGAGPAGLSAAVYGASEGLRTVLVEPAAAGGQAGTSSLIRNYLGFAQGVSGRRLARAAGQQAILFGTAFVYNEARNLAVRGRDRVVTLADGGEVVGRAVVIACGAQYRRLGVPELEALLGSGVFYGAAVPEAKAMQGGDVFVVGAGNSAGQAAMHLARFARRVTVLVRGDTPAATMSDYLVRELEASPNVAVRVRTRAVGGSGAGRLERLALHDAASGDVETVHADGLFILIGAEPNTAWLGGTLERDERGYLLTGRDLGRDGGLPGGWPLERQPFLLETSIPGVFAAGDVRHRSIKRVASAVGEGSIATQLVHEYLQDQSPAQRDRSVR